MATRARNTPILGHKPPPSGHLVRNVRWAIPYQNVRSLAASSHCPTPSCWFVAFAWRFLTLLAGASLRHVRWCCSWGRELREHPPERRSAALCGGSAAGSLSFPPVGRVAPRLPLRSRRGGHLFCHGRHRPLFQAETPLIKSPLRRLDPSMPGIGATGFVACAARNRRTCRQRAALFLPGWLSFGANAANGILSGQGLGFFG